MPVKLKPLKKMKSDTISPPKVGEIVEGTVVATDRSSVFLDLGAKGVGIIYGAQFNKARDSLKSLKIGDSIRAKVTSLENEEGYKELSVSEAAAEISWEKLKEIKRKGETLDVKIKKINKGGLITRVEDIIAFLPASQLSAQHYPKVEGGDVNKISKELQKFIGQTLTVKILDLDPKKEKLILSEKAATSPKEDGENYNIGDNLQGEVTGITNFGAFINIDKEVEALLPASELKEGKKPEDALKTGEKVNVKVTNISEGRIYVRIENS